jgi:hypothetical protein
VILGLRDVTRRRFAAGAVNGTTGRWVAGASSDTTIQMSVQPMGDRELSTLPEGERVGQVLKGYTTADIRTLDDKASPVQAADRVVIDSLVYEVRAVVEETALLAHKRVRLMRLTEADG